MTDFLKDIPERIQPYLLLNEVDEPVHILPGPFRLIGSSEGTLEAELRFRWSPSTDVEFEGIYDCPFFSLDQGDWILAGDGDTKFRVPVILTPLPRSLSGRGEVDVTLTVDGLPANVVTVNIQ